MSKQEAFSGTQDNAANFPSAPPSYEQAVFKQPAYNPHVMTQQPLQAAPQYSTQPYAPTVIYAPAPISNVIAVGPNSATIDCPYCHKNVRTVTTTEAQKSAHVAALILALLCCWCCCWIPYCMSSFQDVHHKCPQCKRFIGTYKH